MADWNKLADKGNKRAKAKGRTPYVLNNLPDDPDNEKPIVVKFPDGAQQLEYDAAPNVRTQLQILLGQRDFFRLMRNLKGKPGEIAEEILDEIQDHWDVEDDSAEVPGGKEV